MNETLKAKRQKCPFGYPLDNLSYPMPKDKFVRKSGHFCLLGHTKMTKNVLVNIYRINRYNRISDTCGK